jgi:hypothetical protein
VNNKSYTAATFCHSVKKVSRILSKFKFAIIIDNALRTTKFPRRSLTKIKTELNPLPLIAYKEPFGIFHALSPEIRSFPPINSKTRTGQISNRVFEIAILFLPSLASSSKQILVSRMFTCKLDFLLCLSIHFCMEYHAFLCDSVGGAVFS